MLRASAMAPPLFSKLNVVSVRFCDCAGEARPFEDASQDAASDYTLKHYGVTVESRRLVP